MQEANGANFLWRDVIVRSDTETRRLRREDGTYTTIKLESRWWNYLDKIAERENETGAEMLELIFNGSNPLNRASFIRLWIIDYLMKLAKTIIKKNNAERADAPRGAEIFLADF
jgi:predicted DNA-binding ribbon-helix-helix protein